MFPTRHLITGKWLLHCHFFPNSEWSYYGKAIFVQWYVHVKCRIVCAVDDCIPKLGSIHGHKTETWMSKYGVFRPESGTQSEKTAYSSMLLSYRLFHRVNERIKVKRKLVHNIDTTWWHYIILNSSRLIVKYLKSYIRGWTGKQTRINFQYLYNPFALSKELVLLLPLFIPFIFII